ncbi:MAG: UDP-N-acetylglucosamine 2-epimerase (hydrolyzing) [Verrucomicrobia bacterium TMED56]|nr:MAG: UDP-N-acetylglucosamine 2-epimerase (hydrolyzing) [Verrucomicrobia bacterium TMED56]
MSGRKKIIFITGTRADYGKLIPLIKALRDEQEYEIHLFVTGMHLLERFGTTALEVLRENDNVYLFNNQSSASQIDLVVANTIVGFSSYVEEMNPDMIVVHGDRAEALAGAIVGSLRGVRVAHIEGGELSGTVDEMLRHAVSKLSHLHLVANEKAAVRLERMGESPASIEVVGSPDIDVMLADELPALSVVKKRYSLVFSNFAIAIFHPVVTEPAHQAKHAREFANALLESRRDYVLIDPNNDPGHKEIMRVYDDLLQTDRIARYPSIRFSHFLTLLKSAEFVVGNSSMGVREAPVYGKPSINIGSRQSGRASSPTITNVANGKKFILEAIAHISTQKAEVQTPKHEVLTEFGDGKAVERIIDTFRKPRTWKIPLQKQFLD